MRLRLFASVLLFAVSCDGLASAQDQMLERSVDRELSVLETFVELQAGVKEELKQGLKQVVREQSDEYDGTTFLFGHIPAPVFDLLLKSVDSRVPKPDEVKAYKLDLEARRSFYRNASALALMLMIDRAAGVQEDQWDRLLKEVKALAARDLLPPVYSLEKWKPDEIAINAFSKVLTEAQMGSLESNLQLTRQDSFSTSKYKDSDEDRSTALKAELKRLAAVQIRWLRLELKLRPQQVRRLELAAKGALHGVLSDRIAAENKLRNTLKNGLMNPSDSETKFAMVDQARLLTRHSRWRRLVLSSLDDKQKTRLLRIEQTRADAEHGADLDQLVITMSHDLALNAKQLRYLRDLVSKKSTPLKPGEWATWLDSWLAFANVTEDELTAAVGAENRAKLEVRLGSIRAMSSASSAGNKDETDQ